MTKLISILHKNTALAETLAWTLQLGTDLKVNYFGSVQEIKHLPALPDLILTDPACYEKSIEFTGKNAIPILLIAANPEDDQVIEALYAGATDVADLGKGPEEIIEKTNLLLNQRGNENNLLIKKLVQKNKPNAKAGNVKSDYGLTSREREILRLMKEANHLKKIAQLTNSSYETVRTHVKHIYKKLGVVTASEAVVKAMKLDI